MAIDTKYGFSAKQAIDLTIDYVGNCSADFEAYMQNIITIAQFRYCSLHDWSFLNKVDLPLVVDGVTTEYELDLTTIGFNMPASSVRQIWNPSGSHVLRKVESHVLRRVDPESDDGSSGTDVSHWAQIGDQRILLYSPVYKPTTLRVSGKTLPTPLTDFASIDPASDVAARLTIPYRYQESFLEYLRAVALDRENDDRAQAVKTSALQLVRQDMQYEEERLGDNTAPRIRHWSEQAVDGNLNQLNSILFVNLPTGF